ncbi:MULTISPECIES: DUF732 domain-containing protein [unclassified Microbacterium]|uniref:DUF732 domain-containing protein n=1 Tax=unclassified Microbacterium TaxID=2609290 RepID=UPI00300FB5DD
MKRTPLAAVAAVLLLALAGCAGTTEAPADASAAPETTTPTETPTAEPLVAEEPKAPEVSPEAFISQVRDELPENTQIPNATDQQLLDAGMQACDRIRANESTEVMSLIEGEQPNGLGYFADSGVIISAARANLCPDLLNYVPTS